MNEQNNMWAWVVGAVAVLIIIAGIWWWVGQSGSSSPSQATTDQTATTTDTGSPVTVTDESSQTVANVLSSLPGASTFLSLASSTGVISTLSGKGPYTVFVSTDAGYALLKPGTIGSMTAAQQKRMIQYSIVSGRALDVDVQNNGSIKTLSGDEVNFKVGSTGLVQVDSAYAIQEYKASNGIIYVLNQPLLPPTSGNILTP